MLAGLTGRWQELFVLDTRLVELWLCLCSGEYVAYAAGK